MRHLLGLAEISASEIRELLTLTRAIDESAPDPHTLAGRQVANLFFEDSTRTRSSFTAAAQNLGAGVVDLVGGSSSVNKGETLSDTARVLEAMNVDAIVVRSRQAGVAAGIAARVDLPVINAGDGRHEHPTQGLLDLYTFAEAHDRVDGFDLSGLTLAIVGDIAASRVARSAIAGFTALGAKVVCVGPAALAPAGLTAMKVKVARELDEVISAADGVMMLRIQFERYGEGKGEAGKPPEASKNAAIGSVREYRTRFALTAERAARMKHGAVIMHPGPMNRGIEIDAAAADGPRSVILRQVARGVTVRMAVLKWCLEGAA